MSANHATPKATINTVISDFGGVLTTPLHDAFLALEATLEISLEDLGSAMAAPLQRGEPNPLYRLERGEVSEANYLKELSDDLAAITGRRSDLSGFGAAFFAGLHRNEEMIALIIGLRDRGFRMALLTNNVREWAPLWRSMVAVDEIFTTIVDSSAVGLRKPEPEIYRLTLAEIGATPKQCLFIDDVEPNCEAARALGIRSVQFRDNEQALAEIETALAAGPEPQLSEPARSQT